MVERQSHADPLPDYYPARGMFFDVKTPSHENSFFIGQLSAPQPIRS